VTKKHIRLPQEFIPQQEGGTVPDASTTTRSVNRAAESEPLEGTRGLSRAQALAGGAAVAAGALAAGGIVLGGLPRDALSKPSRAQDARVLDWLLQVEYMQAAFYTQAEQRGVLRGELREFASLVGEHERAHVAALKKRLRGKARKAPKFDFGDATTDSRKFVSKSVELEEIAVSAFNGQVANLTRAPLLMSMEIVSVEARHVGWARDLAGRNPAPRPADRPATQAQTKAAMKGTGFLG
jgi:ferritin-like protein